MQELILQGSPPHPEFLKSCLLSEGSQQRDPTFCPPPPPHQLLDGCVGAVGDHAEVLRGHVRAWLHHCQAGAPAQAGLRASFSRVQLETDARGKSRFDFMASFSVFPARFVRLQLHVLHHGFQALEVAFLLDQALLPNFCLSVLTVSAGNLPQSACFSE